MARAISHVRITHRKNARRDYALTIIDSVSQASGDIVRARVRFASAQLSALAGRRASTVPERKHVRALQHSPRFEILIELIKLSTDAARSHPRERDLRAEAMPARAAASLLLERRDSSLQPFEGQRIHARAEHFQHHLRRPRVRP